MAIIWACDAGALVFVDLVKMLNKYCFEHSVAGVIDETPNAAGPTHDLMLYRYPLRVRQWLQ